MSAKSNSSPKILILYSKTGGGHFRVARSVEKELKQLNPACHVTLYDGLEQTNYGLRTNPSKGFLLLTSKLLHLYNAGYLATNNHLGTKLLRKDIKETWGANLRKVIDEQSPDIIISTHHFLSPSTIKGPKPAVPFLMVVSDLGHPHKIWFDSLLHTIFVLDRNMVNYANSMLDEHKLKNKVRPEIINCGFPIGVHLGKRTDKQLHNTLLLMGGGAGTGNLEEQAIKLVKSFPNKKIIVVCGNNEKLKIKLLNKNIRNLQVYGFINNIDKVIDQSDIVITKAGPNTIMENILHNKPLIITSWVGMQEKGNGDYVKKLGVGISIEDINDLPVAVNSVYNNYKDHVKNTRSFKTNGPLQIANYALNIIKRT